jgi:hypothetical protein
MDPSATDSHGKEKIDQERKECYGTKKSVIAFGHGLGARPQWRSTQDPASETVCSLCLDIR